MRNVNTIEMSEDEHGLIGCGNITVNYIKDGSDYEGYYKFIEKDFIIKISPESAKKIFEKLVMDETPDINIIYRLATDSCGIPLFRLKEKTNKTEVVFARYLVFWYVYNHLNYSLKKTGALFGKDHATVLHGINIIKDDPKYLKEKHRLWRKVFMNKLKEKNLI